MFVMFSLLSTSVRNISSKFQLLIGQTVIKDLGSYNFIKDTINSYQLTINYVSVTLNRNASDVVRLKIAFNFVVGCLMCAEGWVMDSEAGCLDIDECFSGSSPCKENEFCVNNEGSYTCLGKYTRPFQQIERYPLVKQ